MREMGIAAICLGPTLSRREQGERVHPYLLRDLRGTRPTQVWGIDVTYIPLQAGWMDLVAVLDWFSRYIVSWELDDTLQLPFVLASVQRALAQASRISGTATRAATSPARNTATCCWRLVCGSVWTARGGRWTTSSWSGSGARSSTRRSIPTPMPPRERSATDSHAI